MSTVSPFVGLNMPRELACEFFATFSRFEFALKENDICYISNGRVSPDWNSFRDWADENIALITDPVLMQHLVNLTKEPPQVQTAPRGWANIELQGSTVFGQAINAAQRVRNNLFHGGKYTPNSSPGRDEMLVTSAMALLYACLILRPALGDTYNQHVF